MVLTEGCTAPLERWGWLVQRGKKKEKQVEERKKKEYGDWRQGRRKKWIMDGWKKIYCQGTEKKWQLEGGREEERNGDWREGREKEGRLEGGGEGGKKEEMARLEVGKRKGMAIGGREEWQLEVRSKKWRLDRGKRK